MPETHLGSSDPEGSKISINAKLGIIFFFIFIFIFLWNWLKKGNANMYIYIGLYCIWEEKAHYNDAWIGDEEKWRKRVIINFQVCVHGMNMQIDSGIRVIREGRIKDVSVMGGIWPLDVGDVGLLLINFIHTPTNQTFSSGISFMLDRPTFLPSSSFLLSSPVHFVVILSYLSKIVKFESLHKLEEEGVNSKYKLDL